MTNVIAENLIQEMKITVPRVGDQLKGTVIFKKHTQVFVDLGIWGTGIIYGQAFYNAQNILKNVKPGDEIFVQIAELENEEGYVELAAKEADKELVWDSFKKKKETGEILKVKINQVNRGGLLTIIDGLPAFLPVSQLSFKNYPRVEDNDKSKILAELQKFINQEMEVKLIDVNPQAGKLIISEKEVNNKELESLLDSLKVGEIIEGVVSRVADFGAFIKFVVAGQEVEGLVHISEMDWNLTENPGELVKAGDKIKVKIIDVSDGRISLSLKALQPDPWQELAKKYKRGDSIEGVVYKHTPYGAFVKIDKYIYGLCHLSEFESEEAMKQKLNLGKNYQFKISSLSVPEHRFNLTPQH